MSTAEAPEQVQAPQSVDELAALCDEIDAFLAKPMHVQQSDYGALAALCARAGVERTGGELTDVLSKRLADRRYDLGVDLDRMKAEEGPTPDEPTTLDASESADEKAARDAAALADFQREWEERNDEIERRILDIDQFVHRLEKEMAPLAKDKREAVKEKRELLVELGARQMQGPPTELPPPGGPKQTAFDFDGTSGDKPVLEWEEMHDHRRDVPYLHATSCKVDERDDGYVWRIYPDEGRFTLHHSDPELGPPDESTVFEDQDLAKAEAERLERAIGMAEKQRAQLAAMEEDSRYRSVALVHFGLTEKLLEKLAEAGITNIGQYEDAEKAGELQKIKGVGESTRSKIADSLLPFWDEWNADHEVALAKYA